MRKLKATLVALVLLWSTPVFAQTLYKPAARQGYFLAGGVRTALFNMRDEDLGSLGFFNGGLFSLRFGQMSNEWIGFGLALAFGGGQSSEWSGGYGALSLDVQFKPLEKIDLAIRAGVGVGGGGVGRKNEDLMREDDPDGTFGALYTLGLSYDWFPFWDKGDSSGGFAVTSFIEGQVLPGDGLLIGGLFIGVEVTYWFGLPKNQLELPPDEAFKK